MSTDPLALAAMERRTKERLAYFELVVLRLPEKRLMCFLCIGDHALFLVSRNLKFLYPSTAAGAIPYAHIDRATEDTRSCTDFCILLNDKRHQDWQIERLYISAEHRHRLLERLKVAWQTDHLWRCSKMAEFPCNRRELPIDQPSDTLQVLPFQGYKAVVHEGYSFFLKQGFEDKTSTLPSGSTGTYVYRDLELKFMLQVNEPCQLSDLENGGSEHIRWVALRHKQGVAGWLSSVLVLRNHFYQKRMNLTNDIACWTGWEMVLKSDTQVHATIFLRRQYMPPLMDSVQDIYVTLTCPKRVLDSGEGGITEDLLLAEVRLAADSASPLVPRCAVPQPQTYYPDMIQAKLDSLLFSEDAMSWIRNSAGLEPDKRLRREARTFVKSILKILQEENALPSSELLDEVGRDEDGQEILPEKVPMDVPRRMRKRMAESLKCGESDEMLNAWSARVARYLAYCLDGALLGSKFTLLDIVDALIGTRSSRQKIDDVVYFLLHVRPKDLTKKFQGEPMRHLIHHPNVFIDNTFNDRMMQSLVELKWVAKALSHEGEPSTGSGMTLDYTLCLSRLLTCRGASINLKASVCRQLMTAGPPEHFGLLCPALMGLLDGANIYLRAYATAALSSMAAQAQRVRTSIMEAGILHHCTTNLGSSDDDLIHYTLVLLTHLSKNTHNRAAMYEAKLHMVVMTLLEKTPAMPSKQALLAELASVIGQLCNRDEMWKDMLKHLCKPVDRLKTIFMGAPGGGRLRSKVMFALMMFTDRPEALDYREALKPVLSPVMRDLKHMAEAPEKMDLDCAMNAILLLGSAVKSASLRTAIWKNQDFNVLSQLSMTQLGTLDSTRDRLQRLQDLLADEGQRQSTAKPSPKNVG